MAYNYSELDTKNLKWFPNDTSRRTLLSVVINIGKVRGLEGLRVDFSYPITVIAGRNGSGKTTVIALAACAYHNSSDGYRLSGRKTSYYTYSDFFVQTSEEKSVTGVRIRYQILHNNWFVRKKSASREGPGWQHRVKQKGGRWNNYDGRVRRTVVYLGINRIVPHAERSISKNSRKLFRSMNAMGWENEVKKIVGGILGKDYSTFEYRHHSIYRIPIVSNEKAIYSGFNMGAGEESLFELFSIIKECPDGSLILIDEIELGLHEDAQARLIEQLKLVCEERKFQFICTTHSPRIIECLPPEGRIFLEHIGSSTYVIPGISPAYATGKLAGRLNAELDILVEDDSAKLILETGLSTGLRERVKIIPIGSSAAVMRHLAARYLEKNEKEICVFLDGDKESSQNNNIKCFINAIEKSYSDDLTTWVENRLNYLSGATWPEHWVVSQRNDAVYLKLSKEFDLSIDRIIELLDSAKRAGKHNEFYEAARILNLDRTIVAHQLIKAAFGINQEESERINIFIQGFLK